MSDYDEIKRRIQFFKIDHEKQIFKRTDMRAELNKLSFVDGSVYMDVGDGEQLAVWDVSTAQQGAIKLIFARIRRKALPETEYKGSTEPLKILEEHGLMEKMHIIFFADGVVGAEYNHYAPKLFTLRNYLEEKCPLYPKVIIEPFANKDFRDIIKNVRNPSKMTLSIGRQQIGMLKVVSENLYRGLSNLQKASDAWEIEIVLKQRKGTSNFGHSVSEMIENFAKNKESRQSTEKLEVYAIDDRTGKRTIIDLLQDRVVTDVKVAKLDPRHNFVKSEDMFKEISHSYDRLRPTLDALNAIYKRSKKN